MRAGHTEAGCDLAQLAGLTPSSVICEILKEDGSMARLPDLALFAQEHGLKIGTIRDLIEYRHQHESLIERIATREMHTPYGVFQLVAYQDNTHQAVHFALVKGRPSAEVTTIVRVHEPLSVADLLDLQSVHSWNLHKALAFTQQQECAVLVLLHRTETGQDLLEKLFPSEISQASKWDSRTYGLGAQILRDLGVKKMQLLANPSKMPSMTGFGLEVTGFLSAQSTDGV
jgi:3,4-dihydroxy 2-butanone 4-phosphate synthase / GTP cyclohydrolase II